MTPSARIVDNGIGPYEFWGHKGNHVQLDVELDEYLKLDVTDNETIDETIRGTVEQGCDGEHAGRCNKSCRFFEINYVGILEKVEIENDRKIAYYALSVE